MNRLLAASAAMLRVIGRIEMIVGAVILSGIVVVILTQVVLNAGLGNPLLWEQEGGAYALVWLTFIGASVGLKEMRHVTIITFVTPAPARLRALFRVFSWFIVVWLMVILMRELIPVMGVEGRAVTVALPINLPRSWFFSVPLFISSALMAWTAAHYLLANLWFLINPAAGEPHSILRQHEPEVVL